MNDSLLHSFDKNSKGYIFLTIKRTYTSMYKHLEINLRKNIAEKKTLLVSKLTVTKLYSFEAHQHHEYNELVCTLIYVHVKERLQQLVPHMSSFVESHLHLVEEVGPKEALSAL